MLGDSNIWYILHQYGGYFTEMQCTRGDTVIKGNSYKILGYCQKGVINEFSYLRDDTTTKRVYAIPPLSTDTTEVIYCDFNLNLGDSIFLHDVTNYGDSIGWFYVDSVYTYNSPQGSKKAIGLHGVDNYGTTEYPIWIEGIGSIGIPEYPSIGPDIYSPYVGQLSCFFRDSSKVFESELSLYYGTCDIHTGIVETNETNEVLVFPNPTDGKIYISTTFSDNYIVTIYSFAGQQVWQSYNSNYFDLTNFDAGIYFLQVSTNSKLFSKKVIKLL
jgi:hypothetical protein